MAKHRKAFRFRMRPTKAQESILNRLAGARRWVWNWGLRRWKDYYEATDGRQMGSRGGDLDPRAIVTDLLFRWLTRR